MAEGEDVDAGLLVEFGVGRGECVGPVEPAVGFGRLFGEVGEAELVQ